MAKVSLHFLEEDVAPEDIMALDSFPYWSYICGSDSGSLSPHRRHTLAAVDDEFTVDSAVRASGSGFSGAGDRKNQVNFVVDLFHERVKQSHVIDSDEFVTEPVIESSFGVIEQNDEMGINCLDLELRLGLGLGSGSEISDCDEDVDDHNCGGFIVSDGGDEFFISRRQNGNSNPGSSSRIGGLSIVGIESDSDEEEGKDLLEIDVPSEEEDYTADGVNDREIGIPLCWDSVRLEDHVKETNDFEWEEVDDRVDEREVLSIVADHEEEGSTSVLPISRPEEEGDGERERAMGNLGWEVLLNANNLDSINDLEDAPYFGRVDESEVLSIVADHDDEGSISALPISRREEEGNGQRGRAMGNLEWEVLLNVNNLDSINELDEAPFDDHDFNPADYEMMLGDIEVQDAYLGRPPASKSVVERLPSVVMTQEDVVNEKALCAVCKDQLGVGEQGKELPCSHRYHGDCILPWLGIRNTCPVCRYELPTDDPYYEQRRIQIASRVP